LHISAWVLGRSVEHNFSRLSGMGKPVFGLDTIPLHECEAASRGMSAQHQAWHPAQHPHNVQ